VCNKSKSVSVGVSKINAASLREFVDRNSRFFCRKFGPENEERRERLVLELLQFSSAIYVLSITAKSDLRLWCRIFCRGARWWI